MIRKRNPSSLKSERHRRISIRQTMPPKLHATNPSPSHLSRRSTMCSKSLLSTFASLLRDTRSPVCSCSTSCFGQHMLSATAPPVDASMQQRKPVVVDWGHAPLLQGFAIGSARVFSSFDALEGEFVGLMEALSLSLILPRVAHGRSESGFEPKNVMHSEEMQLAARGQTLTRGG